MRGDKVKIHTFSQRSLEWFEVRVGKFCASDFAALMPAKSKPADSWTKTQMDVIYRVAAERMTGTAKETSTTKAMEWGIQTEPEARIAYEMETGREVQEVGFIELSDWIGCSPDGLIGDDAGLEIKCPNSETHVRYLCNPQELVDDYYWQVMGGMLCSGRSTWDLYSFDPRFKNPKKQSLCVSVIRSDAPFLLLLERLKYAIAEVKKITGESNG